VNCHRTLGHIDLACDRRDSRHFLPRLGPSQMAGFFTGCEQGHDQEGRHHHHQAGMAGCTQRALHLGCPQ
jgi:hypothetical protein